MILSTLQWLTIVGKWLFPLGEWAVVAAILYEGYIALREYRSTRLFDAIKYVESDDTRKARKMLYEKLVRSEPEDNWWERDDELAGAASTVCAMYNLLGALTKEDRKLRKFVVAEWATNIRWTFTVLKGYIVYRERSPTGRSGMFRNYKALYDQVLQRSKNPN